MTDETQSAANIDEILSGENYGDLMLYKDKIGQIIQGLKTVIEKLGGDNFLDVLTQNNITNIEAIIYILKAIPILSEAAKYREQAFIQKEKIDEVAGVLSEAYKEYNSDKYTRSEERAMAVVRCLGFNQSKRKSKIDKESLYWEYLNLIFGRFDLISFDEMPEPLSKPKAIETLVEKYQSTWGSILEQLRSYLATKENKDKGILPGRSPYR
ncbi:MAG: hypothetical protein PHG14_06640 [Desulfobacter postgatei]|uniref:hypothetical protein n=1 Tax=Desulfobacter postgatei TaxID=2293 RepID=UPI0023F20580|nr:hypothetical protein [Desulfobacter postgatei]MDD4273388.1 hypothetical protein [Desulfobacter postgatei]